MLTNHRQIPIREKILGLYYNDFQTDAPCTDSQIPARAIENSLFSSPVEKVGLIAASGGFAAIALAIGMSVWRVREARHAETYGSARWANAEEVKAAGLLDRDGVALGRFEGE